MESKKAKKEVVYSVLAVFFIMLVSLNIYQYGSSQFSYLSQSFIEGKLYFLDLPITWADSVFYHSHHYWPLGPMPSVLMIPFQFIFSFFGRYFPQGYFNILLVAGIIFLVYTLAKKIGFIKHDIAYLILAFLFASPLIGPISWPISWWVSHVLTVLLLFWLLNEYLVQKRTFIYGLIIGMLCATRFTAGIGALILIVVDSFLTTKDWKARIIGVINLFFKTPLIYILILLLAYNYLRFGNWFEFGYNWQILGPDLNLQRSYGTFSFYHIPGNLYYALIKSPDPVFRDGLSHVLKFPYIRPDHWGMSLLYSSPWLIYLFGMKLKGKTISSLWTAVIVTAILVFSYYGIGVNQVGYRYALDFLPYVFLIFMLGMYKKYGGLTLQAKTIIIISAFFNFYLFFVMFTQNYE